MNKFWEEGYERIELGGTIDDLFGVWLGTHVVITIFTMIFAVLDSFYPNFVSPLPLAIGIAINAFIMMVVILLEYQGEPKPRIQKLYDLEGQDYHYA